MKIYIVTMYRFGDREKHSYVLGAWSDLERAKHSADIEITWRAGKYLPEIMEVIVDAPNTPGIETVTQIVALGDMK